MNIVFVKKVDLARTRAALICSSSLQLALSLAVFLSSSILGFIRAKFISSRAFGCGGPNRLKKCGSKTRRRRPAAPSPGQHQQASFDLGFLLSQQLLLLVSVFQSTQQQSQLAFVPLTMAGPAALKMWQQDQTPKTSSTNTKPAKNLSKFSVALPR